MKIGWRLKSLLLGLRPSVRFRGRNVPSAQADGQPKALETRFQPLGNPEIPVLGLPADRGKVTEVIDNLDPHAMGRWAKPLTR